eukprot:GEMP01071246.1.p2 GENE.GEMP01071246.1~~GEMP01071246.1.p2  ORF type:complete len:143 (+),score=36.17 GEMP01071246.1:64-429(+)
MMFRHTAARSAFLMCKAALVGGAATAAYRALCLTPPFRDTLVKVFLASSSSSACLFFYVDARERRHANALARMERNKGTLSLISTDSGAITIDAKEFDDATGFSGQKEGERLMKEELETKR